MANEANVPKKLQFSGSKFQISSILPESTALEIEILQKYNEKNLRRTIEIATLSCHTSSEHLEKILIYRKG